MNCRSVFLIGGGPSLKNFDFSILEDYFTIGANKIFIRFNPNILFCTDRQFYEYIYSPPEKKLPGDEDLLERWKRCPSRKMFAHTFEPGKNEPSYFHYEKIEVVNRLSERRLSFDLKEGIWFGNNSGFAILMLAIALGCKNIYLLGYDMKIEPNRTHFHNGYPEITPSLMTTLVESFKQDFIDFAPQIKQAGITVINLNPDSALECFEKATLEEVL